MGACDNIAAVCKVAKSMASTPMSMPPGRNAKQATLDLITRIRDDGRIYLTQTRIDQINKG